MLTDASVPKPSQIIGLTSLPMHSQRTARRVAQLQEKGKGSHTKVSLYCGDAIYRRHALESKAHPLRPSNLPPQFDAVIAIDCAYHFKPRQLFLTQVYEHLAPNGRVALADVAFSSEISHLASIFVPMPRENMITISQYVEQMTSIGYVDVTTETVSQHVFPSFIQFLRSRGLKWRMISWSIRYFVKLGAEFIIISGRRP